MLPRHIAALWRYDFAAKRRPGDFTQRIGNSDLRFRGRTLNGRSIARMKMIRLRPRIRWAITSWRFHGVKCPSRAGIYQTPGSRSTVPPPPVDQFRGCLSAADQGTAANVARVLIFAFLACVICLSGHYQRMSRLDHNCATVPLSKRPHHSCVALRSELSELVPRVWCYRICYTGNESNRRFWNPGLASTFRSGFARAFWNRTRLTC